MVLQRKKGVTGKIYVNSVCSPSRERFVESRQTEIFINFALETDVFPKNFISSILWAWSSLPSPPATTIVRSLVVKLLQMFSNCETYSLHGNMVRCEMHFVRSSKLLHIFNYNRSGRHRVYLFSENLFGCSFYISS